MDAVLGNISDPSTLRKYARPVIAQHCPAHAQFARHVRAMVETSWKDDTCGAFFPNGGLSGDQTHAGRHECGDGHCHAILNLRS